jgi:hypothetical protein
MAPPAFEGINIPGGVVEGGLVQDESNSVWLVSRDRTRELVRGGREDTDCTIRATTIPDISAYPINMAG